jgi:hypothetical protein
MTGSDSAGSEDEKDETDPLVTLSIFDGEIPTTRLPSSGHDFKVPKSKKLLKSVKAKGKSAPRKKSIIKTSAIRPVKKSVPRKNAKPVKDKTVKTKSAKDKSAKDKSAKNEATKDESTKDKSDNDDMDHAMDNLDVSPGFKKYGAPFVAFQLELNKLTLIMVQGVRVDTTKLIDLLDTMKQKVKQSKITADKKNQKMEHAIHMADLALGELLRDPCKMAHGGSKNPMTRLVEKASDSVDEVSSDEDSVESVVFSKVEVSDEKEDLMTEVGEIPTEISTEVHTKVSTEVLTEVHTEVSIEGGTSTENVDHIDGENTGEEKPTV